MIHASGNRVLAVFATAALIGSGIAAMSGTAAAEPRAACATPYATNGIVTDFDDDGIADVVGGAPGAHHGAGEVRVSYGNGHHLTVRVIFAADSPAKSTKGDRYGAAVAAGDLDGNRCTDLVVGIPGLTVDGVQGAGGVQILYGAGPRAFAPGPLITRATPGVPGNPSPNEHFGAALDLGSSFDLRIGVPGADVPDGAGGTVNNAGSVLDLKLSRTDGGPVLKAAQSWQGSGVSGKPGAGAHLGSVLADRLIGAPDETVHGKADAGFAVSKNYTTDTADLDDGPSGIYHVSVKGKHAGEQVGAALGVDVSFNHGTAFVGAPGRMVHGHANAGGVFRITGVSRTEESEPGNVTAHGYLTQASPHVPGGPKAGNGFGTAIGVGHRYFAATEELAAIGVPGATVKGTNHAGAVVVLGHGLRSVQPLLSRATPGIAGALGRGDRFGTVLGFVLTGAETQELVVGVPSDTIHGHANAGSVEVAREHHGAIVGHHSQLLTLGNDARANDQYGAAVSR